MFGSSSGYVRQTQERSVESRGESCTALQLSTHPEDAHLIVVCAAPQRSVSCSYRIVSPDRINNARVVTRFTFSPNVIRVAGNIFTEGELPLCYIGYVRTFAITTSVLPFCVSILITVTLISVEASCCETGRACFSAGGLGVSAAFGICTNLICRQSKQISDCSAFMFHREGF